MAKKKTTKSKKSVAKVEKKQKGTQVKDLLNVGIPSVMGELNGKKPAKAGKKGDLLADLTRIEEEGEFIPWEQAKKDLGIKKKKPAKKAVKKATKAKVNAKKQVAKKKPAKKVKKAGKR